MIDFSMVLRAMKDGMRIRRKAWQADSWLMTVSAKDYIIIGEARRHVIFNDKLPFILICNSDGKVEPWAPTQTDIMSTDWEVYDNGREPINAE